MSEVDHYIESAAPQAQPVLQAIRCGVQAALPAATQTLAYRMPAFKLRRTFFYFAAFKRHIGVYPPVAAGTALAAELQPYANKKGNLAFALDRPVPVDLIVRVAVALAAQYAD